MKDLSLDPALLRLVVQYLDSRHGLAPDAPAPKVPRARLWKAVASVVRVAAGSREAALPGFPSQVVVARRMLRWLDVMERPLGWGCPVPMARLVEALEGMVYQPGFTGALRDAPWHGGDSRGLADRCRALARHLRRSQVPEWGAVAARMDAWATSLRGRGR